MKKNKKQHHEEHADETWLIPYADILTLLLALFIVMYAISAVDIKKFNELSQAFSVAFNSGSGVLDNNALVTTGTRTTNKTKDNTNKTDKEKERLSLMMKEQENLEKVKKKLDEYIKQNGLSSQLETNLNQSQLMITISDTALFDSGRAAVKKEARNLAVVIADMLQQFPDYEIIVSGHTDNRPISTREFESNWELSSSRALQFMKILLQNTDLNPKMFSAIGYGEYHPVATNDTEAGRAQNRRVEVSIIRKYVDAENQQSISANPANGQQ
ncbi:flagellar motor protein MotB [Paenibacillus sp. CECT 9249]|uniref:flagellar motor protein MotB n=1 Tax=unclassified Paenibacillus TaxID=185978 RepID=UPI001C10C2C5|nr:flagellar motor protein MotB [Paenibacillus sp. CECT 9249]MBU5445127.1 flagellar motor protein MotB [Paenibacillus sp. MSJ-34]CAH0122737.1 Motility protein B [Paenibacillus sp. CECT 9249]